MEAEVTVKWPEELLPELGDPDGLATDQLLDALGELWPQLAEVVKRTGPGCLWPGALRWEGGWQIASIPLFATGAGPAPLTPGAKERDSWAVISALVAAVAGRRPRDASDAVTLLDLHAGVFPHGLDAIVNGMLAGFDPARVYNALRPKGAPRVVVRVAHETGVGSRKAGRDPLWDNEDAFTVARTPGGGRALVVCDGVTGDGDGSGAEASRAAVKALQECLADDPDVRIVLGTAEQALRRDTKGACTAVIALIHPDGRTELASLGDSSAWLVRPLRGSDRHLAFRLTPAHTVLAENLIANPAAERGGSMLSRHLGGHADEPYVGTVRAVPGDRIVLLSDGAAVARDAIWFGADLAALAAKHPGHSDLAAALVARSELLGGHDNATALIGQICAFADTTSPTD